MQTLMAVLFVCLASPILVPVALEYAVQASMGYIPTTALNGLIWFFGI